MTDPDSIIFTNPTEGELSEEFIQQAYKAEVYAFVADNGRGGLDLAYGPAGNRIIPLASSHLVATDDELMRIAGQTSAYRGTPLYLVKLVISDVLQMIDGVMISNE